MNINISPLPPVERWPLSEEGYYLTCGDRRGNATYKISYGPGKAGWVWSRLRDGDEYESEVVESGYAPSAQGANATRVD